jgi:hypothetical protein
MAVSTEALLVGPRAFGLTTASPLQRAIARAADGLPLGDLAHDPVVSTVFGGPDVIAKLPNEPPKEFVIVAAIRSGKSLFSAALALKIALTIDLSFISQTEIARVSVVSLDKDKAKVVMQHLMGALEREGGALCRYLVKKPKATQDRVFIRRDDGRKVEIVIAAGKAGGGSLVSRWTVAAIFDEAARQQGQADGIVNYDDMRAGVIARLSLVKGAQLIAVSSPWAARGPIFEAVQSYKGPSQFMVLVQATGPQLNPRFWTPEACETVRLTDEGAYVTDVLGLFADAESGLFIQSDLIKHTREHSMTLPREAGWHYFAAQDPAISRNAWTLVIVGYAPSHDGNPENGRFRVARTRQWQGSTLEPLKAKVVLRELAEELRAYGLREVHSDSWGAGLLSELAEESRLTVITDSDTTVQKDQRWLDLRNRVISGQVELSPDPTVRADLLSARKRLTANGTKIDLPITRDGRHADFAPALNLAIGKAAQGPGWAEILTAWRANNKGAPVY